jgi:hypothetical protein
MVWINVTANPTAEWVARQITEAFPWDDAPKYLIRDGDQIYGASGSGFTAPATVRTPPRAKRGFQAAFGGRCGVGFAA